MKKYRLTFKFVYYTIILMIIGGFIGHYIGYHGVLGILEAQNASEEVRNMVWDFMVVGSIFFLAFIYSFMIAILRLKAIDRLRMNEIT